MTRAARQLAAAAASFDHASEPEPDWALEDRAAELADEIATDPERRSEAAGNVADQAGGIGYAEMIDALDRLAGVQADRLIGSDALASVLRIADSWRTDVNKEIAVMARDEAEKEAAEFPKGFRP